MHRCKENATTTGGVNNKSNGEDAIDALQGMQRKVGEIILKQQGTDLLNSTLANVLFDYKPLPSTLPFGKVTKEGLFLAHNPDLHYYYGTCEKALEILQTLCTLLVPKDFLENQCQLNIAGLYSTLWKKVGEEEDCSKYFENEEQDIRNGNENKNEIMFTRNLKSDYVENLLIEFGDYSKIMTTPRIFASPSEHALKFNVSYSTMVVLLDKIITGFEQIHKSYENTEFDKVFIKTMRSKAIVAAAIAKVIEAEKKHFKEHEADEINDLRNKKDVGTQKTLNDDGTDQKEQNDEEEEEGDDDAIAKYGQLMKSNEKIKALETNEDTDTDDQVYDNPRKGTATGPPANARKSVMKWQEKLGKKKRRKTEHRKKTKDLGVDRLDGEEEEPHVELPPLPEEIEFGEVQKRRSTQLKQFMVEKYLSDGILRMVSVLDTYKHTYHYAPTPVIKKTDPLRYCC